MVVVFSLVCKGDDVHDDDQGEEECGGRRGTLEAPPGCLALAVDQGGVRAGGATGRHRQPGLPGLSAQAVRTRAARPRATRLPAAAEGGPTWASEVAGRLRLHGAAVTEPASDPGA